MTIPEASADHRREATTLHVVLEGESAKLEEVPAQDIARLIEATIRSIARAAESVTGRQPSLGGRRSAAVEEAARLRLVEVRPGSVALVLQGPEQPDTLDLELDDERLTERAINRTLDAVEGTLDDVPLGLASALAGLGEELGVGERYETVRFDLGTGSNIVRTCRYDHTARTRLRQIVQEPKPAASSAVSGTLVEADFERLTARLRTPTNRSVKIAFTDENADSIQHALRKKAEFDGVVTYDPNTQEAQSVEMHSIVHAEQGQLDLESGFWENYTVRELAAQQGVAVSRSLNELHAKGLSSDDFDSLFEALGL